MCCSERKAALWRARNIRWDTLPPKRWRVDDVLLAELEKLTQQAGEEFDVFLTARIGSSAGMAIQKLDRAWELIRQLPLYNKLPYRDGCGSVVSGMICDLRDDEQKHDRMLTTGTRENELLRRWQGRYRGMAAGNIPRRCHNCGRWFLLVGAYDTVYCRRTAPGETKRTCRQVGAHRKEGGKERQGVCLPRIREGVQPVEDMETAREAQRRGVESQSGVYSGSEGSVFDRRAE